MPDPKVKVVKLSSILPDSHNANLHSERGRDLLEKSLRERGFFRPMAAAGKGGSPIMLAGNLTQEVAASIGMDEALVIESDGKRPIVHVRTDLDPDSKEARLLGVEDNRIASVSLNWNPEVLKSLAEEIPRTGLFTDEEMRAICDATGEEDEGNEVEDVEPDVGRGEELREKYGISLGQIWQLGRHKIACSDCTDRTIISRLMGDDKADLLFTDPPYGVSIGAKNRMLNSFQPSGRNLTDIESDDLDADSLKSMLLNAFRLSREFLSDQCSVFVCAPQGGNLGLMMMMMMMKEAGLEVRHVLNWVKNAPTFSMGRLDYEYQHEPILFTWTKTHKRVKAGQFHSSVWTVDKPRASADHPTMKPVDLPINAILNHTEAGDIVYEPFSGSGTDIIACEQTGRRCRAIELSPAYVGVAIERWKTFTSQEPKLL